MSQLVQMTRHVTSWLGWTPTAPCDCPPAEEDAFQESSGFVTVMVLYLGMAGLFAALNLCTTSSGDLARARAKRELAALERRQAQRMGRHDRRTGTCLPDWLVKLPSLIREVVAPRRPAIMQQRLRMRQRRQKERELEMERKRLEQETLTWQDVIEEGMEVVAPSSLVPQRQKSFYFDLPSESE
ncbi:uncharacterized protein LOC108048339 [Drosophila rhopaloa]|uniref:Uncharacterized protein LOC108048339 n=1 Tax=Drosophila rhopaloa TaxID=1041015 RepID=A0A6P4FFV2_DRORH|nr:uncharacterized protein LOC108048339 [Drosophila rhopaloa]XP_016984396.1 uncharacterized protein LOC108048339 [Drosophila rhopaloa]